MQYAEMLAKTGKQTEAMEFLRGTVSLLEAAVNITDKLELPTACPWLEGMIVNAEEWWGTKDNDPDQDEERAIFVSSTMSGMTQCGMIYPSIYCKNLLRIVDHFPSNADCRELLYRVKKLVETRPNRK